MKLRNLIVVPARVVFFGLLAVGSGICAVGRFIASVADGGA